ncbi:ammonia-forming cytochrome c nitrite reductase subunit c552 [Shewanella intestini]|uniref:nitrite reductase (cytochrome; ammonia-forming) n=1 Tax=Shewanella intestini TaxID=2017544 RepID=A0ABS5HXU1_9GAMM|nr:MULTISPECIES: ammonia-forming cytochrome c nitrite reductase subunit c552 [Shewanella]MBR9726578.1 ammonia-forming cytochrome c nitrite reductase subunit c552 [Shewanella intestini]MRG34856.1 ammonia-forming cytochrome c nitrite reductase subunit c552 [Shewanella sp. XMDDZSB0408]
MQKNHHFSYVIGAILILAPMLAQAETKDINQTKFSKQYAGWAATIEQTESEDMLATYPASVILWAGSTFSHQYNSPRGHKFAVADASHSLRTGVAIPPGGNGKSASCWTCKTPDAPRLIKEMGEEGFSGSNFVDLGPEIKSVIYCSDCHVDGTAKLALPRPHAQNAMAKIGLPFDEQNISMQGAQTCGQCHVTYYFQPENNNKVNMPWIFGNTADAIEKYYDTRRFYEWIHPISKTPMLKARHPDFEQWSRSKHADMNVTCITCHMPTVTDKNGNDYTDHKVSGALIHFDQVCAGCHKSKAQLTATLERNKAEVDAKSRQVQNLLVKAHYEAKAAWDGGATWPMMNEGIMGIRHAQWRWDFATASHGMYAHNPKEGLALLNKAIEQVSAARDVFKQVSSQVGAAKPVYPDISTKAKAQAAIGYDEPAAVKAKQAFIKEEIDKHWHPVATTGY